LSASASKVFVERLFLYVNDSGDTVVWRLEMSVAMREFLPLNNVYSIPHLFALAATYDHLPFILLKLKRNI